MNKKLFNTLSKEELVARLNEHPQDYVTISFYKYHRIDNPEWFRDYLFLHLNEMGVLGRIYIAKEGINAQITVPSAAIEQFKTFLYSISFLDQLRLNYAIEEHGNSFLKLKIKIRNKIVADGIDDPTFDPSDCGVHLDANAFNKIIEDPNTILIDMRNHYESEVGHFKGAITPDVVTFRESLPIIAEQFKDKTERPMVMYCTGGIRCEKASAYMKHYGFKNVYQLNGGIIHYARQIREQDLENKFIGKNFVFDERMGERISDEIISQCHQCGQPCDTHVNCANDHCHILFIQCPACAAKYHQCCSRKCAEYISLTEEERKAIQVPLTFNGSKFSKGRYKAISRDEALDTH
ncbi:MAG: rhodanese-related sulfurtransferase [Saprospiraceae bacterium]